MLKQVFVVNTDMKMTCGKICVQVAHAETLYMKKVMLSYVNVDGSFNVYNRYERWKDDSVKPIGMMKKVVLKATEKQLLEDIIPMLFIRNINYCVSYDLGLTQIKEGSLTCLCTEPLEEELSNKLFGNLKLL